MLRRSRRRSYIPRRIGGKYQNCVTFQNNGTMVYDPASQPNANWFFQLIPVGDTSNIRKIKGMRLSLNHHPFANYPAFNVGWAIVFVPQSTPVNTLTSSTTVSNTPPVIFTNMYEPNQNVVGCGTAFSGETLKWSSRYSRNFNQGDYLVLILQAELPEDQAGTSIAFRAGLSFTFQYFIKYN